MSHFRLPATVVALLLAVATAWAALLGINPGTPLITFANPGTTAYSAATHQFSVTTTPVGIKFDLPIGLKTIVAPRSLTLNMLVDNTGALIGGVPGDDLVVSGDVDTNGDGVPEYSGILLTGEVREFGYQDFSGTVATDLFDFRFRLTGGALRSLYGSNDIGLKLTSENSTFAGSFAVDFNGLAKGTLGPIPPIYPCSGQIGDFVWHDVNRDGIQGPGEAGIDDVVVRLQDGLGMVIRTTKTGVGPVGQHGYYQFDGLCAGNYTVVVDQTTLPAGFTPTASIVGPDRSIDNNGSPASVVLPNDNSIDETIDFGYQSPCEGAIGDFVWNDLNRNGVQDAGEPGIANVRVWLKDATGTVTVGTAISDANGLYLFKGLCPGAYVVQVDTTTLPAGYLPSPTNQGGNPAADSDTNPVNVTLGEGEINRTIDFGYNAPCSGAIGDFVWNDLNRNGVQEQGEPGINGVTVRLMDSGQNIIATAVTATPVGGQAGYYQFPGLCAGTFFVDVDMSTVPPGFVPSPTLVGADTTIDSNARPSQVVLSTDFSKDETIDFGFNLPCSGKIGDFVWNDANQNGIQDAGEQGIAGIDVNLRRASDNSLLQTTTTDADGLYQFMGLCAAEFKVEVDTSKLPPNFVPSPTLVGNDTALDSNTNPSPVSLTNDFSVDLTIDFGYYQSLPGIKIVKYTNGEDADTAPGPTVLVGSAVTWTYVVTNTGNVALTNVTVTDSKGVTVKCPKTTLAVGEAMTCSAAGIAVEGQYENTGFVTGTPPYGAPVTDQNPSHYFGLVPCTGTIGDFVWKDLNGNGLQDAGEPGIAGVTVTLKDSAGTVLQTTTTNANGAYLFPGLCQGSYTVTAATPSGMTPTTSQVGTDRTIDSNASPAAVALPAPSSTDLTVDFGFVDIPPAPCGAGTGTPGYWKNHPEAWPVSQIAIGGVVYSKNVAIGWLSTPDKGDKTLTLFRALVAAKLNVMIGAVSTCVDDDIADADAWMATYGPVGSSVPASSDAWDIGEPLYTELDDYNNGKLCAPSRDVANASCSGSIGDFVWKDLNANGVQDAGEPGITGVTVVLKNTSGAVLQTQTTSSSGAYLFTNLAAGTYTVQASTPSGFVPTTTLVGTNRATDSNANPSTVTLATGASDLTIDFGFKTACSGAIGDFVWMDANKNGVQDTGESGLTGVTVQLKQGTSTLATTTTNAAGFYQFNGLCSGTYTVTATTPAGYTPSPSAAGSDRTKDSNASPASVTLSTNATTDNTVDFGFYSSCTGLIGDLVWNDANKNGIQDSGEAGISGVTLTLKNSAGVVLDTEVTDANGAYTFPGLCAGTFSVTATTPSGYAASPSLQGTNRAVDSNANPSSVTLGTNSTTDRSIDFGFYKSGPTNPGTGTPGYWMNHPEAWPVSSITIGGRTYTRDQAITLMKMPTKTDVTYTMFQALVSAKLNVLIGNDGSCISSTIASADWWMAFYPVGSGVKAGGSTSPWRQGEALYSTLDDYNNGLLCAPHRS